MNRVNRVFAAVKELGPEKGASASQIADYLNLDRANVSNDLNQLFKEGKLTKSQSRPVYFRPVTSVEIPLQTSLDSFVSKNPSLAVAVEQGKAAVLYPPKGLHTIILGETGVGKSMFAGMLYAFGIESNRFTDSQEFISFNCADYSNNPQLLLSHLFGVKKGAYTGALDQAGLLEKADHGILFLDEVHRLPPEGQEMFFKFLDNGTFRRLGETEKERKAKVMIICATSENIQSSLLQTFIRRIPMVISIPPLAERTEEERYGLITDFFKEEAMKLGKEIYVSANTLYSFLYYSCPNNIGQLKNDIQLSCARAYADFITGKKERIKLNSTDLPERIKLDSRKLNSAIQLNHRYYIFNTEISAESSPPVSFEKNQNIYEMIESKYQELINTGLAKKEINKLMDSEIEQSFHQYLYKVKQQLDTSNLLNIIDMTFIKLSEKIVHFVEEKLQKKFSSKTTLGLALHIHTTIERLKLGREIINPKLNSLRTSYKQEFLAALESLRMIEEQLEVSLPIDEAGYLTMFFKSEDQWIHEDIHSKVSVMVMMHGKSTASSMVDTVNQLLGENYAHSIDMPLYMKPETAYETLKERVLTLADTQAGLLLLVDMGSLVSFGEKLQKELGIHVEIIPYVSTPHVLEYVRKAILGYSLSEFYVGYAAMGEPMPAVPESMISSSSSKKRLAIITACLTGQGSAKTIKHALERYLTFDKNTLEIITLNISDNQEASRHIRTISKEQRIICIVSNFPCGDAFPLFSIEDIVNLKGIKEIQALIDQEQIYLSMEETLNNHLKKMDARKIVPDIRYFLESLQKQLSIYLNKNDLIGIVLHISCMLDRIVLEDESIKYTEKNTYIESHSSMFNTIKKLISPLEHKYAVTVSEDEICYIMNFFDWALEEEKSLM